MFFLENILKHVMFYGTQGRTEMHPIFCFIEFQELALMYESRK